MHPFGARTNIRRLSPTVLNKEKSDGRISPLIRPRAGSTDRTKARRAGREGGLWGRLGTTRLIEARSQPDYCGDLGRAWARAAIARSSRARTRQRGQQGRARGADYPPRLLRRLALCYDRG